MLVVALQGFEKVLVDACVGEKCIQILLCILVAQQGHQYEMKESPGWFILQLLLVHVCEDLQILVEVIHLEDLLAHRQLQTTQRHVIKILVGW